ncbi:MAG: DUF4089 domain-containing protein [Hyphomicrobiaceae bacterium]|nr:MAG: DUF4089 domain-containing protein [Hyphomicrobiaceae bacterium]
MSEEQDKALSNFIKAAEVALDLPLDAAWIPAITANLQVTFRHAAAVAEFELPDETEPAPVFEA